MIDRLKNPGKVDADVVDDIHWERDQLFISIRIVRTHPQRVSVFNTNLTYHFVFLPPSSLAASSCHSKLNIS